MATLSARPVVLNVHFEGSIAYAKDESRRLWALMPEALIPTRARWRVNKKDKAFFARAPHLALLITDFAEVNQAGPIRYRSIRLSRNTGNLRRLVTRRWLFHSLDSS